MSDEPKDFSFTDYQLLTGATAKYPDVGTGSQLALAYCGLGLWEAGEVGGKIKKVLRDDDGVLTDERRQDIEKEMGDVLWYMSQLANEMGSSLEQIALANIEKLADRRARGVIGGSGDNR
jgi:NTP pyrophosphatase (non-canonical NTP hydrolase)